MYFLDDKYAIGYNQGRIVLVEKEDQSRMTFLSFLSSSCLMAMMLYEDFENQIRYIQERTQYKEFNDAAAVIHLGCTKVKKYLKETGEITANGWLLRPACIVPETINPDNVRLDFPVGLTIVPTWHCGHHCVYCGVPKLSGNVQEEHVDSNVLLARTEEGIRAGVQHIDIHGGDPIIYSMEMTCQLLALCRQYGVSYTLSTKSRLTKQQVEQLVNHGLTHMQLSFDSIDPLIARELGYPEHYMEDFQHNLNLLHTLGVKVNVNVVKTRKNEEYLEETIQFLQKAGADSISVSPLKHGRFQMQELIPSADYTQRFHSHPICSSGRSGLGILPNGKCFYCDFLAQNSAYQFGDIRTSSILEIWDSEELKTIMNPEDRFFRGSECLQCEKRTHCVSRGLCYLSALENGVYQPDAYCVALRSKGEMTCS